MGGAGRRGEERRPSLPLRVKVRWGREAHRPLLGLGAGAQRGKLVIWTGQVGEVAHTLACKETGGP